MNGSGFGWALLAGLCVPGMLFGAVWSFIGFFAGGPFVGVPLAIAVYGCYRLRRYSISRIAALERHQDVAY